MPTSNPPVIPLVAVSGSYVGNGAANAMVPHGLGTTPKIIFIHGNIGGRTGFLLGTTQMAFDRANPKVVTAVDATNFYVSPDGALADFNQSGQTYNWVALA